MMILHKGVNNQEPISRQQRRAMEREAAKKIKQMEKTMHRTALPVTFDNQTITQFGLFGFLEAFKHIIGWQQIVKDHLSVNQQLLAQKFRVEKPREVWLDFDDSVVTVFGEQEESAVGYNPRYHGRRSYKVKVAFISDNLALI